MEEQNLWFTADARVLGHDIILKLTEVLKQLRDQRPCLVSTADHYVFAHRVVVEYFRQKKKHQPSSFRTMNMIYLCNTCSVEKFIKLALIFVAIFV
jgi:hypothetical protein